MIISAETLLNMPEFAGQERQQLQQKLDAIEQQIRSYTGNNFQNRAVRFFARSEGKQLLGVSPFLEVGDTIQISQSAVNDGLYSITAMGEDFIQVDQVLFAVEKNLVTKIAYPADLINGVLELMKWEVNNRSKVGIKSETLSRYSVSYYDMDANNQVLGYPVSLLGFLAPYKRARFT